MFCKDKRGPRVLHVDNTDEFAVDPGGENGSDGTEPLSLSHWLEEGHAVVRVPANVGAQEIAVLSLTVEFDRLGS